MRMGNQDLSCPIGPTVAGQVPFISGISFISSSLATMMTHNSPTLRNFQRDRNSSLNIHVISQIDYL